jgi:hypothetical protein
VSQELRAAVPDPTVLLSLAPEELAGILLPILQRRASNLSLYNFVNEFYQMQEVYPRQYADAIGKSISEAWTWMTAHGLLAPDPRQSGGDLALKFPTRRNSMRSGKRARSLARLSIRRSPTKSGPISQGGTTRPLS